MDLQTTGGDLINAKFMHRYCLPPYGINKKSLNNVYKESNGMIEKVWDVQMPTEDIWKQERSM